MKKKLLIKFSIIFSTITVYLILQDMIIIFILEKVGVIAAPNAPLAIIIITILILFFGIISLITIGYTVLNYKNENRILK